MESVGITYMEAGLRSCVLVVKIWICQKLKQ